MLMKARLVHTVLMRYPLQRGIAVLVTSRSLDRLEENLRVLDFNLTPAQMKTLGGLKMDCKVLCF